MKKEFSIYEKCVIVFSTLGVLTTMIYLIKFIIWLAIKNDNMFILSTLENAYLILSIFSLIAFIIGIPYIAYIVFFKSRKYIKEFPKEVLYNSHELMELHIQNFAKGNRRIFLIKCLNAILTCVEKKKDIMFDTCFIKEKKMREIFGDNIEIQKPSFFQRINNNIFRKAFQLYIYFAKYKIHMCKGNYRRYIIRNVGITNKSRQILINKLKEEIEKYKTAKYN